MPRYIQTITADGSVDFDIYPTAGSNVHSIYVVGDFGSGTVSLFTSPDNKTTFVAINDSTGSAISYTANGATNFEVQSSATPGEEVALRATLAGATDPDVDVILFTG